MMLDKYCNIDWIIMRESGKFSEIYSIYKRNTPDTIMKTIKCIIVGDSGVGKTSILQMLVDGTMSPAESTIGVEFGRRTIDTEFGKVSLQIWDAAGQHKFRAIVKSYFRFAKIALLVYDKTSRCSYNNVISWLTDIKNNACDDTIVILVGNKIDLHDHCVTTEEAKALADEHKLMFYEVSAKTTPDLATILMEAVKIVAQIPDIPIERDPDTIILKPKCSC